MEPINRRVIGFVNQKGGVTKTTLAAQVAYGLARRGKKVLAVDLDPQGNLTQAFGMGGDSLPGMMSIDVLETQDMAFGTVVRDSLDLILSDVELAKAEMNLIGNKIWQFLLKNAIRNTATHLDVVGYEYIIIDSPPNLGLLTVNVLVAASEVIIPVTCDAYALNGVAALMDTIGQLRELNGKLAIAGFVASKVDMRRNIDKECLKRMESMFGDLLFKTRIPESTKLKEAGGHGKSIWDYDSGGLAAMALNDLVDEIVERNPHDQGE